MIRASILIVGLLFLFSGYGCTPAGVIASGSATTMVIAEGDKSFGTVVDDATIKLSISGKFLTSENNLFLIVPCLNYYLPYFSISNMYLS